MDDIEALFDILRHAAGPEPTRAIETLVREGADEDLGRVNALRVASERGLDQEGTIAAFLHAARIGIFDLSWNIICPSCGGVLDANQTLKTVRQAEFSCAFCALTSEPTLDDLVEVSFTVSPRVRRIGAHEPGTLGYWAYHRQVFFGSAVDIPTGPAFDELARKVMLETIELGPHERMIVSLQLPADRMVIVFDPVTHSAQHIQVEGAPTSDRQELTLIMTGVSAPAGRGSLRPGPLRLTLDNRSDERALPGVFLAGPDLDAMLGGRRPFLTAKRLLSNQTFRDLYRTDTLDVDQRLKITSLTFLFTDLKGSTELYEQVGDLVAYDLVRAHFRALHAIVASEGGAVVKTIGDAVMATFPTPERAVAAALRMRGSMREIGAARGSDGLILKIGLHEGPCLAVNLNDRQDYFGQTVNIASRVQQLAVADTILATGPVVGHAGAAGLLQASGIDPRREDRLLRGVGDRMPVFQLA